MKTISVTISLSVDFEDHEIDSEVLRSATAKYLKNILKDVPDFIVAVGEADTTEYQDPYVLYNCYKIENIE